MFCFIFLLGHNILRTELMAGLCKQNCNATNVSLLKKELLTTYYVYIIKFILSQKETLFLASS